ncbi:MAG TPA: acetyl-CoA C-acetyltransferase [Acidimicrobiales bacterium]|nr:acetyl-CoA C-acetyltransferase [Acidimicrobiales bacterium]
MSASVILSGARTPIGRLSGALSPFRAFELGAIAIKEAILRAGISPSDVDSVILGHVLQAGQGQGSARQAAVAAGIPMSIPSLVINKVCLSGLQSIYLADLMIRAGEADIVVAGGMESMTNAPYLLHGARNGLRFGNAHILDAITSDGLTCAFEELAMGAATEAYANRLGISRREMDAFAMMSHRRAAEATASGRFSAEIAPVTVDPRRGDPIVVKLDEGIRSDSTSESLGALAPAFTEGGCITAGNASQISDGAAAVIIASKEVAERLGVTPLGELVGYGQVAGPDPSLLTQPSRAIRAALDRAGRTLAEIELFEINEAFAAVTIASMRDLEIEASLVNVNGGAIALGHPVGMSGTRLVITLCIELARRGGGLGAVALCGGGGQGDAALLSVST